MPARLAVVSFAYGVCFGLLKIVWIVVAAVYLYDIAVDTGQFEIMKQSVAAITQDADDCSFYWWHSVLARSSKAQRALGPRWLLRERS